MEPNSSYSMQDLMRLASTPAGQQLFSMLQQHNSAQLQKIIQSATAGDYKTAQDQLRSALSSPDAQALLRQLEDG